MAKPRPRRTDTQINELLQTFYDSTTSELPVSVVVEGDARMFAINVRGRLDRLEFDRESFGVAQDGNIVSIYLK